MWDVVRMMEEAGLLPTPGSPAVHPPDEDWRSVAAEAELISLTQCDGMPKNAPLIFWSPSARGTSLNFASTMLWKCQRPKWIVQTHEVAPMWVSLWTGNGVGVFLGSWTSKENEMILTMMISLTRTTQNHQPVQRRTTTMMLPTPQAVPCHC